MNLTKKIEVIAFDADDTLWVNNTNFRETEARFVDLLKDYLPKQTVVQELYKTETNNISIYGYGVMSYTLSMIETLVNLANGSNDLEIVGKILQLGKDMLQKPVELLDDVEYVLAKLSSSYKLVLATKGDLLNQENKLHNSGLEKYFDHIEVMSDKGVDNYRKLLNNISCDPKKFMMVGDSLKSDIIPVLDMGSIAVHIPGKTTWVHEMVDVKIKNSKFYEIKRLKELVYMFKKM